MSKNVFKPNYIYSIYKSGKTREEKVNRGYESTIQEMMCSLIFITFEKP